MMNELLLGMHDTNAYHNLISNMENMKLTLTHGHLNTRLKALEVLPTPLEVFTISWLNHLIMKTMLETNDLSKSTLNLLLLLR